MARGMVPELPAAATKGGATLVRELNDRIRRLQQQIAKLEQRVAALESR